MNTGYDTTYHVELHCSLQQNGPGHPPINTPEPHRTTITNNSFGEVSQRKDDWTVMGNAALPSQWKGTTSSTQFSRIHTDSTAGKSIATRQGTSKRAKHIDLKFLYTLIKHDIIRILKINTLHNSAVLFTKYISKETLHMLHPGHWGTQIALRTTSATVSQQQQRLQTFLYVAATCNMTLLVCK